MRRVVGSSKVFNRQKASSTVWYTNNEVDENGSGITADRGLTLPHAATAHIALDRMDKDQTNTTTPPVNRYSPHHILGSRARWLLGMPSDGIQTKGVSDEAKLDALKAECERKITKIQGLLEDEMKLMQEKTTEFLVISRNADSLQAARIKSVYEKKARKAATSVRSLQLKLEMYSKKLERLNKMTEENSKRFRNRGGSLDNISSILEPPSKEPLAKKVGTTMPRNSRYRSAEFLPPKSQLKSPDVHGEADRTLHFSACSEEGGVEVPRRELDRLVSEIRDACRKHRELERMMEKIKVQIDGKREEWRALLEESRFRGEGLEEQINDMMELHQQQVVAMKQEFSSLEEKLEYQMEERTRDLQDLVDVCQTKISKLEFQQQQQQQQQSISVEALEGFSARGCATRAAHVLLDAFAFCLVVVSFVVSFARSCLQNRILCLAVCWVLLMTILVWRSTGHLKSSTSSGSTPPAAVDALDVS